MAEGRGRKAVGWLEGFGSAIVIRELEGNYSRCSWKRLGRPAVRRPH